MSKYCPLCLGEYNDNVKTCGKDGAALTSQKPAAFDRLINFYLAVDGLEAEHLVSLLIAEGIVARESTTGISQLPVAGETQFVIMVLQDDVKHAKTFVEQARRDGVISTNGSFC